MGTPRYSKEFKAEAVRLFKAGNKPVVQLAKELGVAAKSIRDWAKQADADASRGAPGVLPSGSPATVARQVACEALPVCCAESRPS